MYVIGTAGHVDHGKSTLVKALTGMDPDRLREEREREMTIDLGFAWLSLPSGRQVSVVDVPGHERFIKNMLAGVGGIDLAILVIAADESVMPQTREHLSILDLLSVKNGLIALTKADMVDEDWIELVSEDVREVVKGTVLENAPLVTVSAMTGQGLTELTSQIDQLLEVTPPRKDLGRPRLPIDRVFSMTGFGTVVTGTLLDGTLSLGQEIELVPAGLKGRVRGLQSHRTKMETVAPGTRVAVNFSGVNKENVSRGQILTTPGWLQTSSMMDGYLKVSSWTPQPVRHNAGITYHSGTNEIFGRVRLLDSEKLNAGEEGWVQIQLKESVPVVKGDSFILRSAEWTLGGGRIVDPFPRRHRRFQEAVLNRLNTLVLGSPRETLLESLDATKPTEFSSLINEANLSKEDGITEISGLVEEGLISVLGTKEIGSGTYLASADYIRNVSDKTTTNLTQFHAAYPLRLGMPKEELRRRLNLPANQYQEVLSIMEKMKLTIEEASTIRIVSHQPTLSEIQEQQAGKYIEALQKQPYSPPTDMKIDQEVLSLLVSQRRVVKISEEIHYAPVPYKEVVQKIENFIQEKGKISVGDLRDMVNTSRKYALPFLEHLDSQKITRRVGDDRVLI